jgi:hypothetical protein
VELEADDSKKSGFSLAGWPDAKNTGCFWANFPNLHKSNLATDSYV